MVLQEPKGLFYQKAADVCAEGIKLFIAALELGGDGLAQVQTKHFHKADGADLVLAAEYMDGKTAGGGNGNKVPNLFHIVQSDFDFPHIIPPGLYKRYFIVYNGGNIPTVQHLIINNIIPVFRNISIVGLDD